MEDSYTGGYMPDDKETAGLQLIKDSKTEMKEIMDVARLNWPTWIENLKGEEQTDDQGKPIYNNKVESQFIDTYISKFTQAPDLDLIPDGTEDRNKIETIKVLFARAWDDGQMTHKQQAHLRQEATLGLSMVYIGGEVVDNLIKVKVPTEKVDEKGEVIYEDEEYRDRRVEIFKDVIDMRGVFIDNMPTFADCRRLIWQSWVPIGEWTEKYEANGDYKNLEYCQPVIKMDDDENFRYPNESDGQGKYYKITRYYEIPSGDKMGDRFMVMVNDQVLIYDGELPTQGFGRQQQKQLPFSLKIHKQQGIGLLNATGMVQELEQGAKTYNKALHQYRLAAAMASVGFLTLEDGGTLKNPRDKIFPGAILEITGTGRSNWNKAPAPDGTLLQVANDAYENMVRITGIDPRSSVVAQKVTTAFQRAAEEKAQSERLAQYEAEDQVDMQRQAELIVSNIIQYGAQLDIKATMENMKKKKGQKGRYEPVYKSVSLEDVAPLKNKDGKVVGLKRKSGIGMNSIIITPDMLDFSGTVRVKTATNRPIYELSDKQLENQYISQTLIPLLQAKPMFEGSGIDADDLIKRSMEKNDIMIPVKDKDSATRTAQATANLIPAASGTKAQVKLNKIKNEANQPISAETMATGATPSPGNGGDTANPPTPRTPSM